MLQEDKKGLISKEIQARKTKGSIMYFIQKGNYQALAPMAETF